MFKVGDKVRVTRSFEGADAGMEGEVYGNDPGYALVRFPGWARGHDGARRWAGQPNILPEGSTEGYYIPENNLELIPTEQEKPMEQVYEVGGTITLSEAIEAAKRGEIVESVTQGGKVHWHDKCLRWTTQNEPVSCSEANLTGWRVVPKPVPMTRELQEALQRLCEAPGRIMLTQLEGDIFRAYEKAKEAAK